MPTYNVEVSWLCTTKDYVLVEVEADNEDDAKDLAIEQVQCDDNVQWNEAGIVDGEYDAEIRS